MNLRAYYISNITSKSALLNNDRFIFGFSTGCFYKVSFDKPNKIVEKVLEVGGRALEIQFFTNGDRQKYLAKLDPDLLSALDHITLHLSSKHIYKDDKETVEVLERQLVAFKKFGAIDSILHPDIVQDKGVIQAYNPKLNILIENMDNLKADFKSPEELRRYDEFPRVLDLQHIYTNDPDMKNINDYIPTAGLREVHISAYNPPTELHYPLFKKKQDIIIKRLSELKIDSPKPVIIESVLDDMDEAEVELKYIQERLL